MRMSYCFCGVVLLFLAPTLGAIGQVVPSGAKGPLSVTVGIEGSVFQPSFSGQWDSSTFKPISTDSAVPLLGAGVYADIERSKWLQIEAAARWLRFNQRDGIYQDNYLVGPRFPIISRKRMRISGRVLIGIARMSYGDYGDHGRFSDIAFGGTVEVPLKHNLYIRLIDAEYQYWPKWGGSTLSPYGCGVGIGYKFF